MLLLHRVLPATESAESSQRSNNPPKQPPSVTARLKFSKAARLPDPFLLQSCRVQPPFCRCQASPAWTSSSCQRSRSHWFFSSRRLPFPRPKHLFPFLCSAHLQQFNSPRGLFLQPASVAQLARSNSPPSGFLIQAQSQQAQVREAKSRNFCGFVKFLGPVQVPREPISAVVASPSRFSIFALPRL